MELLTGCMRRKYWDRAQLPGWEYEVNWWYQIFNLYWKKVFHQIQFEGEWGRRQTCLCPVQWLAGGGGEWCHSFWCIDDLAHESCAMYWLIKYFWWGLNNELSNYILSDDDWQKVVLREFGSYQGSGAPIPQGRLGGKSFRYPRVGTPRRWNDGNAF